MVRARPGWNNGEGQARVEQWQGAANDSDYPEPPKLTGLKLMDIRVLGIATALLTNLHQQHLQDCSKQLIWKWYGHTL